MIFVLLLRTMKWVFLISLFMFIGCTGCELFQEPEQSEPQIVDLSIAWSLPVTGGSINEYGVHGTIAVRRETATAGLVSFNIDTGEVRWRISDTFVAETNPVIIDSMIIIQDRNDPYIHFLDIDTGEEVKRIIISEDGTIPEDDYRNPFRSLYYWTIDGTTAYWGSYRRESPKGMPLGLLALDLENDLISTADPDVFIGVFDVLYENDVELREWVRNKVYIEDNVLYFHVLPQNPINSYWEPRYRALSLDTGRLLWETEPQTIGGGGWFLFEPYNGDLFLNDGRGVGLIDKDTGELEYETELYPGSTSGGFSIGKYIYATNASHDLADDPIPNIICWNMDNGEMVWGYLSGDESLGNRPVVYDGLCFVAAQTDIMIMDALTGEFLAVSEDARGGFNQMNHNILYNEKYMIVDADSMVYCIDLEETAARVER